MDENKEIEELYRDLLEIKQHELYDINIGIKYIAKNLYSKGYRKKPLTNQDKLKSELNQYLGYEINIEKVISFIIEDRKRILEPLIKLKSINLFIEDWSLAKSKAIEETLKNAGVEE